jgi:hypothetical protein
MAESVADKTPTPTVTVRRHVDPPGLWIALLSCSLMRSLSLNSYTPKKTSTAIPIDFIQVRKTRNTQKPKSTTPIQTRFQRIAPLTQPPQTPKISPQKVQPAIPVTPKQDSIAFANPRITKKTAIPIPKTKPPIKQQAERKVPPKPQVKSQLEQQFERELAQQQRQQQLAERQRQQEIAAQQRQQELAEQKFQRQIAEQQRQQELAEQKFQRQIAEQQRQQQLAEQKFQRQIAEQQRQQELAEKQRQQEIIEQQSQQQLAEKQRQQEIIEQQRRTDEVARNQREVPKSSDRIAVNKNPPPPPKGASTTETADGFWTANLSALPENVQIDLNSITGKLQSPPQMEPNTTAPNKLPLLNEKDRKLIKQAIKCPVLLSIDAKGQIFNNNGIRISDDAPQKDICKRYAEEYFRQNRKNIKFIPARDKGNIPASGGLFVDLTIQPVTTSDGIAN